MAASFSFLVLAPLSGEPAIVYLKQYAFATSARLEMELRTIG
jgi:hypothetical protein